MALTQISNMVNPKVMADMISAKIEKKIVVAPFAKVDDTLAGVAGDTIVVPRYSYIGDAADVAEGVAVDTTKLITTTTQATVKKAMKAVELSDEAVLSGYGNPIGETNNQLAAAIAAKVDNDAMDALQTATVTYTADGIISYDGIIDALDKFGEETNCRKVIFVHPSQLTQLRHDEDFISKEKYGGDVAVTGEIGMIANTIVVPSKKVPLTSGKYICPIVKIDSDSDTEDETPALTIYLKRDTNVETERQTLKRVTDISVDKFYTVVLSNESKVVLAKFAKEATTTTTPTGTDSQTNG